MLAAVTRTIIFVVHPSGQMNVHLRVSSLRGLALPSWPLLVF